MNKKNKGRKLSLKKAPRMLLLRVLANNFLIHEKIKTTEAKAKELRSVAEKLITKGKNGDLQNRRLMAQDLTPENLKKVIDKTSYLDNNRVINKRMEKAVSNKSNLSGSLLLSLLLLDNFQEVFDK